MVFLSQTPAEIELLLLNEVKNVLLNSVYVELPPPAKLPYNNLWSSAYTCDSNLHKA